MCPRGQNPEENPIHFTGSIADPWIEGIYLQRMAKVRSLSEQSNRR